MKTQALFLALSILLSGVVVMADDYNLNFSTYIGGSDWEHGRDICSDDQGNIYIVGGTTSSDFPTTAGAFQRTQDKTGTYIGSGGYCDAFVCKFGPNGNLIWSTMLGGPNYDRAYAVEVDSNGYVYVAGRSGPGFPVTSNAFQTTFAGTDAGIYGMQNGFIAKIQPDGSALQWCAYVGVGQRCRDLSIDNDGDVYLALSYLGYGPTPPASWFSNAYQPIPSGGKEIGAMKISTDGTTVLWATWFGGSNDETGNCGIRLDSDKNVLLNFTTKSTDMPTTAGAHDQSFNGVQDAFLAKLSPDGSSLIYGTYFGGSANEAGNSTHNMAVDTNGNAYLATFTTSTNIPVTPGAFQSSHAGGSTDIVVAKFSTTGELLKCTYIGGSGDDGPDGIYTDVQGNVFITGSTSSASFPITAANAFQTIRSTPRDTTLVVLAADFASLNYSTFMGGTSYDDGRACYLDTEGNLYLTGSSNGPGWPTLNAYQSVFAGGGGGQELCYEGGCYAGDVILAKFDHITHIPGDAERDGDVDITDFLILKYYYGKKTGATWEEGDFDADGDVDIYDFLILKGNYGT